MAMVTNNKPPIYIQIPVGIDPQQQQAAYSFPSVPFPNTFAAPTQSSNNSFSYDQFMASPDDSDLSFERYSSDENEASFQNTSLRSSNNSMGLSNLLITENDSNSSDEEYTARRKIRRRTAENTNRRRMVAKKKLTKSNNDASRFSPDFPNPISPQDPAFLSPVSPAPTEVPASVTKNGKGH